VLHQTLASSRSAGFTYCFFSLPSSFAGFVNASLQTPQHCSAASMICWV